MNAETCVVCGAIIPEGRQVCPTCARRAFQTGAPNEPKPENPAKTYLRRYRAMITRRDSLQRAIEEAYDRATSCTQKLRAVHVDGGNAAYDRMAEDVIKVADSTEQLKAVMGQIDQELQEILRAIDAVPDEMQKTILTLRYIEGLGWTDIQERLHYEERHICMIHGRGLWHVKKWLEAKTVQ